MTAPEKSLALAPRATHAPVKYEPPDIFQTGEMLARSGYFQDARDAAQTFVKILAGRELGIGDIAAMTGIYIVKGRVTLSANLMAALVKRSGRYNYRVRKMDDTACEIEFYEDGQACGTSAFTAADARAAGLGGDNWKKFPKNMLFARAMSNGVKWFCPDVSMAPIYTPDELGVPVDGESGEVVEGRMEPHAAQVEVLQPETAHALPAAASPAIGPQEGTARRELLERVTGLCIKLGYDTAKQLTARGKAARMSDDDIAAKVIPSLTKLIGERDAEASRLRTAIYAEFGRLQYSAEDITDYLEKNEEFHGGRVLEEMSLDQLRKVAEGLEIK